MPSVYIETTIISYLTARPSKDLVQRATNGLPERGGKLAGLNSSYMYRLSSCRKRRPAILHVPDADLHS